MHSSLLSSKVICALALSILTAGSFRAEAPIKDSPFLPAAGAAAVGKADGSTYELAGMSVAGKATLLSVVRVRDKRSTWVPVGQTVGEITAISYDPKTDQATIRADGKLLTIGMRKSAVVTGPAARVPAPQPMPATVQLPQTGVAPLPATTQEEKETEARMLVTDLLEIGQAQRRAYEEAQRQAAAKGAKAPASNPNTPPKR